MMTTQELSKMEQTIQSDMPALNKHLKKIDTNFKEVSKMFAEKIIPKVGRFANDLMGQFKKNLDEMMTCKAKVDHLIAMGGKNFVEMANHAKEAAQHILQMEKLRKLVQNDIEVTRKNIEKQMHGHIEDMKKRAESMIRNPFNVAQNIKNLERIIDDAARLPSDLAKAAIKTLDETTKSSVAEAQKSKAAAQSQLEKAKQLLAQTKPAKLELPKPLPVHTEGVSKLAAAITSFRGK